MLACACDYTDVQSMNLNGLRRRPRATITNAICVLCSEKCIQRRAPLIVRGGAPLCSLHSLSQERGVTVIFAYLHANRVGQT